MKKFNRRKFKKPIPQAKHRGLTIYYYGDGKGKTTATVGLAVRAHGAGLRVCFIQFMKTEKWQSYERKSLQQLGIPVHVLGSGFVGILDDTKSLAWHKAQAKKALLFTKKTLRSQKYDVVIADESVSALDEGLLQQNDILALIKAKPANVHLVLTGHSEYPAILKACDLATKMVCKKHPFATNGQTAQRGIDF